MGDADREMLLAIRFFYGNHSLDDDSPCPTCEHWVEDFYKMVRAWDKQKAKEKGCE